MGILLRNLADLDQSLPYMIAILPSPHTYGRLPRLQAPILPAAAAPLPVATATPQIVSTSKKASPVHRSPDIPKHDAASNAAEHIKTGEESKDANAIASAGEKQNHDSSLNPGKKKSKWSLVKVDEEDGAGTETQKSVVTKRSSILTQRIRSTINESRSAVDDLSFDDAQLLSLGDFEAPDGPGAISQVTRLLSLRKSPLLKDIPGTDLRALAHSSVLKKLESGQDLIRVGTISPALYTIVNGTLGVLIAGDTIEVAVISSGGMVGEMSMLTGEPAGATCRAKEGGCSVLEITKETMMKMVQERATLRAHLDAFVSNRLAANAQMLEKASEQKARKQEEQMQKDDGANFFEEHPWASLYRNSHLEPRPSVLPASFFELQIAYGFFLSPQRAKRALILNRFAASKPGKHLNQPRASAHSKSSANSHEDGAMVPGPYDDDVLEKAAQELHKTCLGSKFCVQEYVEPEHSVNKCLEFLSGRMVEDFGGPTIHNLLWRFNLINEQVQ